MDVFKSGISSYNDHASLNAVRSPSTRPSLLGRQMISKVAWTALRLAVSRVGGLSPRLERPDLLIATINS